MRKIFLHVFLSLILLLGVGVGVRASSTSTSNNIIYRGESVIYKDSQSILLLNTIFELTRVNFISNENFSVVIMEDNYSGNGSRVGSHSILLQAKGESVFLEKEIEIVVKENLSCDFFFDKDFYFSNLNKIEKKDIVNDLKTIGFIPNVPVNVSITSEYFNADKIEEKFYQYSLSYVAASGLSGSFNGRIICEDSLSFDYIDDLSDSNSDVLNTIIIILSFIISGFMIIIILKFIKKGKKKRKFE